MVFQEPLRTATHDSLTLNSVSRTFRRKLHYKAVPALMIEDYVARLFSVEGKSILFLQMKTFRECIGKCVSRGIGNPEFHGGYPHSHDLEKCLA